jgi:uncharacterized protein involved in outer membrane biogenesis
MKRIIKLVAYTLAGLALIVLAASVVIPIVVDPNDYKDTLANAVKEHTGRDLRLTGDIQVTVFPWLGVRVGALELGNAAGFVDPVFARVDEARIRVKLLALLRGSVEVDVVTLNGLTLNLARDAQGLTNWDDLVRAQASPATASDAGPGRAVALTLGGLAVRDGTVRWRDETSGQRLEVSNFAVKTGAVTLDQPITLTVGFDVAGLVPEAVGRIESRAEVELDLPRQTYRLQGLNVDAVFSGTGVPGGKAVLTVRVHDASLAVSSDTLSVTGLEVRGAGLAVGGLEADVTLTAAASGRLGAQTFDVTGLALEGLLKGPALAGGKVDLAVATDLSADLTRGIVETRNLEITAPLIDAHGVAGTVSMSGAVQADVRAGRVAVNGIGMTGALSGGALRGVKSDFEVQGNFLAVLAEARYALDGLVMRGTLTGEPVPEGKQPFTLRGSLLAEPRQERLTVADFALDALGMKAAGGLALSGLGTRPTVEGSLQVDGANPRALMRLAGMTPPVTEDPQALRSASFRATVAGTPGTVKLEPLEASLDGARLTGSVTLVDLARSAVEFDLNLDALDVDRYLPPAQSAPTPVAPAPAAPAPAAPAAASANAGAALAGQVAALRALEAKGRVQAGAVKVKNVRLRNVRLEVSAKDGLIVLEPFDASLYEGAFKSRARLDVRADRASLGVEGTMKGVRADQLLADLAPQSDLGADAANLRFRANVAGDLAAQRFRIEEITLEGDVAGKKLPGGRVVAAAGARLDADLAAGRLALDALRVTYANAVLTGKGSVTDLHAQPSYELDLVLDSANPRELLATVGQPVPPTADPKALTRASASATIKGTTSAIELAPLQAKLDDTTITGTVSIPSLDGPAVRFDVALDALDLDRYLPPPASPPTTAKPAASPAVTTAQGASLIPVETVRMLDLDGRARIGTLKVRNLTLGEAAISAQAKDGVLTVRPSVARLYEGGYIGHLRVDARNAEAALSMDEVLSNVQIGPLLKDLRGAAPLTGLANISAKLNASGNTENAIRRSLGGEAAFSFTDGAIVGLDTAQTLCQWLAGSAAQSLKPEDLIASAVNLAKSAAKTKANVSEAKTEFAELRGTVQVASGTARNADLSLKSPLVRIEGEGQADLASETLDYLARPVLVASCQGQGGKRAADLIGVPVPVRIHGPLAALKYEIKLGSTVSALIGGKQGASAGEAAAGGATAGKIGAAAAGVGAAAAGAAVLDKLLRKKDKPQAPTTPATAAPAPPTPPSAPPPAAPAAPSAVIEVPASVQATPAVVPQAAPASPATSVTKPDVPAAAPVAISPAVGTPVPTLAVPTGAAEPREATPVAPVPPIPVAPATAVEPPAPAPVATPLPAGAPSPTAPVPASTAQRPPAAPTPQPEPPVETPAVPVEAPQAPAAPPTTAPEPSAVAAPARQIETPAAASNESAPPAPATSPAAPAPADPASTAPTAIPETPAPPLEAPASAAPSG